MCTPTNLRLKQPIRAFPSGSSEKPTSEAKTSEVKATVEARLSSVFTEHHYRDETITFHENEEAMFDLSEPPRRVLDQIHVRIRSEQNRARDRVDRIQKLRERQKLAQERQEQLMRRNTTAVSPSEDPATAEKGKEAKETKIESSSSYTNKLLQQIKALQEQLKAKTEECNRLKDELKQVQLERRAPAPSPDVFPREVPRPPVSCMYPPLPHLAFLQSVAHHHTSTTTTTTHHESHVQESKTLTTTTTVTQEQRSSVSSSSTSSAHVHQVDPEEFARHHYHRHPTSPYAWGALLQHYDHGIGHAAEYTSANPSTPVHSGSASVFPFHSRPNPHLSFHALPSFALPTTTLSAQKQSFWSSQWAMLGHMFH